MRVTIVLYACWHRFRSKDETKWVVESKWAPPRRLSSPELGNARKMFYELDRDGSGSIDAEELGVMMRCAL